MPLRLRHRPRDWLLLFALVAMWGSAFLFNRIALERFTPVSLVTLRLLVGAAVLAVATSLSRPGWRGLRRALWPWFLAMALVGNALPFWLIAWGQETIDSGLAGILMAVNPLATLLLAHFLIPGETLTARRLAGFALGFVGIVVLMGPALLLDRPETRGVLLAELAVLGGALCYSAGSIIARLRPESDDLLTSTMVLILASGLMLPLDLASPAPWPAAPGWPALLAAGFLGVIATGLATVVYFRLLRSAGPSFLSQINYLIPVWALALGAVVLDEPVTPRTLLALGLILGGIALAQVRWTSSPEAVSDEP